MSLKKKQGEETYHRILLAAFEVFSEKGYEKASVNDICKKAGITKGGLYFHFHSKEEIFFKLLEQHVEERQRRLLSYQWAGNLKETIYRLVSISCKENYSNSSIILEFYALAGRDEQIRAKIEWMYQSFQQFLVKFIQQQIEEGYLSQQLDAEKKVPVLMSTMVGSFIMLKMNPRGVDLDTMIEELTQMIYSYLEVDV
ncbi:TetR/AcrR family transcriptional regulator [Microaerobacter geothermalis]|uniref:TetR/AcrR family transcriptional regulator n=1 Tax=Microaerobacter geothermalis TaxID=674972 RepID=UPI001F2483DE|nr:TetR/AcrR family transcriptional regulator [Microaerobacter geothermalis]MCF6094870.1 TetR/AcrR family transcriptional regulator [Microaerobacter geothermalis]